MMRQLALLALLLLVGCGGGGRTLPLPGDQPGDGSAGAPRARLVLDAERDGNNWRVVLAAQDAVDLYQIAGTLVYDPTRYQVAEVRAGGGLGDAGTSYFAWGEYRAGRLDFAYTRRYFGRGVNGDADLLQLTVTPLAAFSTGDFALDTAEGALLARDSEKQELAVSIGGEVRR